MYDYSIGYDQGDALWEKFKNLDSKDRIQKLEDYIQGIRDGFNALEDLAKLDNQ